MQLVVSPVWNDVDVSEGGRYNTRFAYLTEYLAWMMSEVAEYVAKHDDTAFLKGQIATADAVRAALRQYDFDVLYYASHGEEDALTAVDFERAITIENSQPLFGRTTYAVACLSAKALGAHVARNGGVYLGYDDVLYLEFGYRGPETDWWVEELYRDIFSTGKLLVHTPPREVALQLVRAYDDAIETFIKGGYDYSYLLHDRDHLVLLGAGNTGAWRPAPKRATQPSEAKTTLLLAAAALLALPLLLRK